MYRLEHTLYCVHWAVYTLNCALYSEDFTAYTVYGKYYNVQKAEKLYSVHYNLFTLYIINCAM